MKVDLFTKKFRRKSQAALEFLTTYGWSFIVVLIVMASFWYFGILNVSKLLPDRCSMGSEIRCADAKLSKTDTGLGVLRLRLNNQIGEPIVVTNWATTSDTAVPFNCSQPPAAGLWKDKELRDVEFTGCNIQGAGFVLGQKGKVKVNITYYKATSSSFFSNQVQGEIYATVTSIQGLFNQPECSDQLDNDHNGCADYSNGDTGCSSPLDATEAGGTCPQNGGAGQPLFCYVSTNCNSDTIVFAMSDLKDAHAELQSVPSPNYPYKVCCKSATDTLSNSCTSPDSIPLHLSASTDAHVEQNTFSNYNNNVCLSAAIGSTTCSYTASPCLPTETCLATISAGTDAHVGDCVTAPFNTKVCCILQ